MSAHALRGVETVVLALVLAAPAAASPFRHAAGSGTITGTTFTSIRDVGGVTIASFVNVGTVSGTLSGTFVEHGRLVVDPRGRFTLHGKADIRGQAGTCGTGTFRATLVGTGSGAADLATAVARGVILSSGLDAVGFQSLLRFEQSGPSFTYAGRYRCR